MLVIRYAIMLNSMIHFFVSVKFFKEKIFNFYKFFKIMFSCSTLVLLPFLYLLACLNKTYSIFSLWYNIIHLVYLFNTLSPPLY